MLEAFLKIVSAIAIAAATSWITVQLSRNKFRTEKLWEKKLFAYERVIDAFHSSKRFSTEHLDAEYRGVELDGERDRELREMAKGARDEILRASDIGSLIISEEAVMILKNYEKESSSSSGHDTWQDYLEHDWSVTEKFKKEFIAEAKRDLLR